MLPLLGNEIERFGNIAWDQRSSAFFPPSFHSVSSQYIPPPFCLVFVFGVVMAVFLCLPSLQACICRLKLFYVYHTSESLNISFLLGLCGSEVPWMLPTWMQVRVPAYRNSWVKSLTRSATYAVGCKTRLQARGKLTEEVG